METLQIENNGGDQISLEAVHASDVIHDDPPIAPRIGSEHQAEIPNLATEDERCQLMASSLYSCKFDGYDYPSVIGKAIPIISGSNPPSEVNKKEDKFQTLHSLETESRTSSVSNQVYDGVCSDLFTDRQMVYQRESAQFASLPGLCASVWNDLEEQCFLLGLHIFGKDFSLLSKFVGSKSVRDMLPYYYGRFYKGDAHNRWSHCRKTRSTRCILGKSIFTGRRQQELISRLKSKIPKEAHNSLVQALKSLSDGLTSLEKCVFTLKSIVGPEAFVEVVGIGSGKHDLTGFVQDTSKKTKALSVCTKMPKGINCSTLAREDIIKFLTGDFRISKAKSNELFWEAVWPRLLAREWHSEQPKDIRTAKSCLVFLVPGIKKFSREKLTKGTHYYDSITDVLKKVAADPTLLELESDGIDNGTTVQRNGQATSKEDPVNSDQELLMFTIIDTTLVEGEEPFKVRALRRLPGDENVNFGTKNRSDYVLSGSSSQEQDSGDRSSDDQEYHGQVTACVNDIEMESVYHTAKESCADLLENRGAATCSVFAVNGHCSDDQHSEISNGNGDQIDLTCFSGLGTKTDRHVYLSPKRRRFSRCSNDQTSQFSFSSPNDEGLGKDKLKPLSTSSEPTVVDLGIGGCSQTRGLASCSTKVNSCEEITNVVKSTSNGESLGKRNVPNINDDESLEGKFDTVTEEGTQVSRLVDLNKLQTAPTGNHDHLLRNEDGPSSISSSEIVPDVLEATGKPDVAVQKSPRRHGTRNRSLSRKALEAFSVGDPGGAKRKGDSHSLMTRRPPKRTRKSKD
ncbi:uncharacterized protein LOC100831208 isoform X2 [Brachypodium distachyon]|nr:uncharacterized protein LOC100831208 isoform X2 [Brachypodium distachyon]PNT77423.1 hypothetical protein BRADI_1g62600v3 [Brachypodium distachyon]|eukprot:XP_024312676.1 uncharacterized protein LOC100831208 isoform X2 [Brachypodium distachyon]